MLLQLRLLLGPRRLQALRREPGLQRRRLRVLRRLHQRRQRKLRQVQLRAQLLQQRKVRRTAPGLRLR